MTDPAAGALIHCYWVLSFPMVITFPVANAVFNILQEDFISLPGYETKLSG